MIKKMQGQKKELLEQIKNSPKNQLQDKFIDQTEQFGQVIEEIILKNKENPNLMRDQYYSSAQKDRQELKRMRRANSNLYYQMVQMKKKTTISKKKLKNMDSLVLSLLSDSQFFSKLTDTTLHLLKEKLKVALDHITEQVITREVSRRILKTLSKTEIDIKIPNITPQEGQENLDPSFSNLKKRPPNVANGLITHRSVQKILDSAKIVNKVASDELFFPKSIKSKLEAKQEVAVQKQTETKSILTNSTPKTIEVDLLDSEMDFNLGKLAEEDLDVEMFESKEKWQKSAEKQNSIKDKSMSGSQRISNSESKVGAPSLKVPLDKQLSNEEVFLREPLVDKTHSNSTANLNFVSPGSDQKSSVYYFTSKKNEFDFSFDRSTLQVARNLGESLFLNSLYNRPNQI